MTREEEIKCASKDYVNYLLDKQEYHNEDYTEDDIRQAFENGAMFADRNPDLSALWHDASKFPNKALPIIVEIDDDIEPSYEVLSIDETDEKFWEYLVSDRDITIWAYVNELRPKGGDK